MTIVSGPNASGTNGPGDYRLRYTGNNSGTGGNPGDIEFDYAFSLRGQATVSEPTITALLALGLLGAGFAKRWRTS